MMTVVSSINEAGRCVTISYRAFNPERLTKNLRDSVLGKNKQLKT